MYQLYFLRRGICTSYTKWIIQRVSRSTVCTARSSLSTCYNQVFAEWLLIKLRNLQPIHIRLYFNASTCQWRIKGKFVLFLSSLKLIVEPMENYIHQCQWHRHREGGTRIRGSGGTTSGGENNIRLKIFHLSSEFFMLETIDLNHKDV